MVRLPPDSGLLLVTALLKIVIAADLLDVYRDQVLSYVQDDSAQS